MTITNNAKLAKVLKLIETEAAEEHVYLDLDEADADDFVVDDFAGGNVDDAFECGERAGAISFARQLLKIINE